MDHTTPILFYLFFRDSVTLSKTVVGFHVGTQLGRCNDRSLVGGIGLYQRPIHFKNATRLFF